jgi:hypothetical protein
MRIQVDRPFTEQDWKYLFSLHDELLEELSRRINGEVAAVLAREDIAEDKKRHLVYQLVHERDRDVVDCFNDLRRSAISLHAMLWRKLGLLRDSHLERLSAPGAAYLRGAYPNEQQV